MTNKINENAQELGAQAKALEIPSSLKMIEVSKTYLSNIEKKFGVFLHKLGIDIGNYDGNLDGNKTGAEKIFKEKIIPLKHKIEKEKHTLKKQDLINQLTHSILEARGIDIKEIQKLALEKGKQKEFGKEFLDDINEESKIKKELQDEFSKLDSIYTVTESAPDKEKIKKDLIENNKNAVLNYNDGKISKEQYEKIIADNMKKARENGVELEVTTGFGKFLELGMQSGTIPIVMMMTPKVKNFLPMLPSVIGIGIWARATSLATSKQSAGEKTIEGAKLVGETTLTIAPITGTFMAGKETYEAYKRYKAGNGSMSEVVANGVGTGVSAAFDGVTVFLVATGVGAAPAVGLQAVKGVAKEAVKQGAKKLISFFIKEGSEKAGKEATETVIAKTPGLIKTTGEFLKGKIELVTSAHKELGTKEFLKRAGKQALEDTVTGVWDIVTLRGIRDSKLMSKLPENLKFFEMGKKASAPFRAKIVDKLESAGLVKKGTAEKIRLKGTAGEFRTINDEANDSLRNDNGATQVEDIHSKFKEELSTKNLDGSLHELKEMILKHDGTTAEFNAVLGSLKTQDEYIGNALNILNKLEGKLSKHSGNNEKLISEIEIILRENKGKVSKSLYEYLETILSKVKAGESFGSGTGNHLVLINKINGKAGVEQFKGGKGYEEYQKMVKDGLKESENGYMGNYQKSLAEMSKLLFSGEIRGERAENFVKEYLEILKNAEKSGRGTIRLESLIPGFAGQIQSGSMKNGYEGVVQVFLNTPRNNTAKIEHIFIKNLDLSLIHNIETKEQIVNRAIDQLKSKKLDFEQEIDLLKHIGFYGDYKALLKKRLTPEQQNHSNKPRELTPENIVGEYHIINRLGKNAKKNEDLLVLLDYAKDTNSKYDTVSINSLRTRIIKNLENMNFSKMTKEEIDSTIRNLEKIGDIQAKTGIEIIMKKILKEGEDISKFIKNLESYESNALFCKLFPVNTPLVAKNIINSNNHSIEFKIRFIEELKLKNVEINTETLKEFASYLTKSSDDNAFINKLDQIEYFFRNSDKNSLEFKELSDKITKLKDSDLYKSNNQKNGKTFVELVDTERSFSDRDLKDLKNNGTITYKTISDIDQVIKQGYLTNLRGEVKKDYSSLEIEKLKIVREKVKTALESYELNLFNHSEYKEKSTDKDKIQYLFDKIDEMTGFKFRNGADNAERLNRSVIKQLNVIKTNFQVEPHIIDGFLYEVLKSTKIEGFNIGEKIKLLNTLERTGIIKPSVEKKQEYIISMQAKSFDELREYSYAIKEYTKEFEKLLSGSNSFIKELKLKQDKPGILKYVKKTIDERVPVEKDYLEGKNLTEGIDYVTIDGKIYITEIYPARYFITQLLNAKDLKQKETYMELIHNKTDFGGKSFREYYDEIKAKGDVETMLLMSYHDDIKYDKDVIDLLKAHSKDHKNLVMYVLGKRKDYDIIIGDEIHTGGSKSIDEAMLKQTLTKSYLEKFEGRKLSEDEYNKIRYGIEKMFQLQKDPMFQKMMLSAKGSDDMIQEDGKLRAEYKEYILKYSDVFENVFRDINTRKQSITDLLNTIDGKTLMLAIKGFGDRYQDKTRNATNTAGENLKSIMNLLADGNIRRDIVGSIREEVNSDHRDTINKDRGNYLIALGVGARGIDNITNNEIKSKVEINSKSVKMSGEISGNKVNLDDYKLPNDLKTKLIENYGKFVNLKTLLGILITFGIMTPTEAQAASEEIGDKWKNSPQYKKYLELGGESSDVAKKLKEETITSITKEVLSVYIGSFDAKYQELMDKKVKELPNGLQILLGNIDIKLKEKIKPGYDSMTISKLNTYIFNYVDSIYKGKGLAEKNLTDIITKFPELNGTEVIKNLLEVAKNYDNAAQNSKDAEARRKINEMLKSIK